LSPALTNNLVDSFDQGVKFLVSCPLTLSEFADRNGDTFEQLSYLSDVFLVLLVPLGKSSVESSCVLQIVLNDDEAFFRSHSVKYQLGHGLRSFEVGATFHNAHILLNSLTQQQPEKDNDANHLG
jgi:hypothetical protein